MASLMKGAAWIIRCQYRYSSRTILLHIIPITHLDIQIQSRRQSSEGTAAIAHPLVTFPQQKPHIRLIRRLTLQYLEITQRHIVLLQVHQHASLFEPREGAMRRQLQRLAVVRESTVAVLQAFEDDANTYE